MIAKKYHITYGLSAKKSLVKIMALKFLILSKCIYTVKLNAFLW
jgi:hypothetical protein